MATYAVNGPSIIFSGTNGVMWGGTNNRIKSVTDEQTDSVWNVGDAVKVEFNSGTKLDGNYRGTFTFEGKEYPVIQIGMEYFVLGSGAPDAPLTGCLSAKRCRRVSAQQSG